MQALMKPRGGISVPSTTIGGWYSLNDVSVCPQHQSELDAASNCAALVAVAEQAVAPFTI
jgi:hypothetical protein